MSQLPNEQPATLSTVLTSHALLVAWGIFGQRMGLVEALMGVPIPQRRRIHAPQTKLLEFLVAILAGCQYLQDISHSPHPLDRDQAVARAWGQVAWADYSGVSRTLQACTPETASHVRTALETVSQSFVEREVLLALRDRGGLVYDGDLTGRPVSNRSTTYPGAAFGWMSDVIRFGYQAALVSMHSPTYGRLWLAVEHHPGDTVSSSQAEALIRMAERRTGIWPRRRTDLLAQRVAQHQAKLQAAESRAARAQTRLATAQQRCSQVEQERQMWADQVTQLEAVYQAQNRPERPYSRLAQARRKLAVRERRQIRRQRDLERADCWLARCQAQVLILQVEQEHLQYRLERCRTDNLINLWPSSAIFRLDGGFGTGPNIALLIEMGYEVYSKASNHQVGRDLRQRVTPTSTWTRVGHNAEMIGWANEQIANCPYALDVALERFRTGSRWRHGVLLHYGATPVLTDLESWFSFYNGRQDIEAGIKEGKNVFQMHHLKVRSPAGLVIQELFAAFAANFVRWAAAWLHKTCPEAPAPFDSPQPSVKQMVRIAANTSAWVVWQPGGCLLKFTELSAFAGIQLAIHDTASFQLVLPLFKSRDFSSI
jgi:hypothetical protein